MVMASFVWHWWIGLVSVGAAVLTVLLVAGQYLSQVTKPQYPKRRQGRQRYARR